MRTIPQRGNQIVYALIGKPVAGNPTGEMMEAAFAAADIDARYLSFEVERDALADAVRGLRALGVAGGHVTVPHKVAVVPHLDRITAAAQACGAVNCLKREGDELVGDNTDGKGLVASLGGDVGRFAVVIGAGGAARAIAAELALAGARDVLVVNRTLAHADEIASATRTEQLTAGWRVPPEADLVVQATTVGMGGDAERLPLSWSTPRHPAVAADVVIAGDDTVFLREAAEHGYRTVSGLGMLVEQAAVGFRWWTGLEPDRAIMRAAVERALDFA
jgi:shikimate dehydrogenase